jgi:branched-chain amino acid transport system substrate-binding protein
VVGAIYPTTGPQAQGGRQELTGVRAALALVERSLPSARNVDLRVEDAETPDQATSAVDRLVATYHVQVIVGTYGSTLSDAAAARADQLGVLYWETGAVADQVTYGRPWVFRTVATGGTLGRTAAEFTHEVLIPREHIADPTVAIVQVDDIYGASVGDAEAAAAAAYGIRVVDRVRYRPGAFSPEEIARTLAAVNPTYLWDVSYVDDGVKIWSAVLASDWRPHAAIGTSSAFCMPEFGQRLGAQAVGLFAADKPSQSVSPDALSPAARTLLVQAEEEYARQGARSMDIPGVAGFVGGWVLFHDVLPRVQGAVTSARLRAAALALDEPEGTEINGAGIRFGAPGTPDQGQNLRAASLVGQWQATDVMRPVWPAAYALAAPILPSA